MKKKETALLLKSRGFTLIELLIVVAIIAILAAIAVPNFLEAQIRSKVARAKNDHRALTTALESYRVDHNEYPERPGSIDDQWRLSILSTPVAYIQNPLMKDPFKPPGDVSSNNNPNLNFIYIRMIDTRVGGVRGKFRTSNGAFPLVKGFDISANELYPGPFHWLLCSYGPDKVLQFDRDPARTVGPTNCYMPYDTTNGTKSIGDIFRFGP